MLAAFHSQMPKYTPLKSYKANGQSASAVLKDAISVLQVDMLDLKHMSEKLRSCTCAVWR